MDRYAVAGHPVEHSQSPFIHAEFARQTGQALVYERLPCALDGFAATVRRFAAEGARGCNVTVPFKFEAFALAARPTPRAQLAGAANTLAFDGDGWRADNTDGIGLARDLETNAGQPLRGRRVLLIGAGGAAAGVLGPLIERGPAAILVANRTLERAEDLVVRHADVARAAGVSLRAAPLAALAGPSDGRFDLVVNASASSLEGAVPAIDDRWLERGGLAVDLMYGPPARPFLAWARDRGWGSRDGLGMLVEQAAEAFWWWRGVRPDTAPVLRALRARLGTDLPAGSVGP